MADPRRPDAEPSPRDLRGAAAAARTLAYAAGLAGAVAGGLLYQQGETAFAIGIWVLTFGVGAVLMIAAFLLQGMTSLLARIAAIESDLRVLLGRDRRDEPGNGPELPPNPWHGGHP
jgi:hypothetical protein